MVSEILSRKYASLIWIIDFKRPLYDYMYVSKSLVYEVGNFSKFLLNEIKFYLTWSCISDRS